MAMTGVSNIFLDTNVVIHATVAQSPFYQAAQQKITGYKQAGTEHSE